MAFRDTTPLRQARQVSHLRQSRWVTLLHLSLSSDRNERNMLELSHTSPPWYSELGFDKPTDVRGRSSIADLFCRSKPRTGIYLLGYSDSTHYIGQAVDVVRRFGGHRRLSPDIESFAFISTRRTSLDKAEQNAIHYAEALRVPLRNRVHVADVLGPVDLDELVPEDSQNRWLNHPNIEISDAADPVMLPPDSPQRWRSDPQFRQLGARPEYATVQRIVSDFIGSCIPAPATTQLSYWSLTALPSTN